MHISLQLQTSFLLEKVILWIEDSYISLKQRFKVKNFLMMDLFPRDMQLFTSQENKWRTGVVQLTYGLLWCFYQLFGLSLWRHPFTALDPLVSKWCRFLQICSNKETNLSIYSMAWGWVNLGLTHPIKCLVAESVLGGQVNKVQTLTNRYHDISLVDW